MKVNQILLTINDKYRVRIVRGEDVEKALSHKNYGIKSIVIAVTDSDNRRSRYSDAKVVFSHTFDYLDDVNLIAFKKIINNIFDGVDDISRRVFYDINCIWIEAHTESGQCRIYCITNAGDELTQNRIQSAGDWLMRVANGNDSIVKLEVFASNTMFYNKKPALLLHAEARKVGIDLAIILKEMLGFMAGNDFNDIDDFYPITELTKETIVLANRKDGDGYCNGKLSVEVLAILNACWDKLQDVYFIRNGMRHTALTVSSHLLRRKFMIMWLYHTGFIQLRAYMPCPVSFYKFLWRTKKFNRAFYKTLLQMIDAFKYAAHISLYDNNSFRGRYTTELTPKELVRANKKRRLVPSFYHAAID